MKIAKSHVASICILKLQNQSYYFINWFSSLAFVPAHHIKRFHIQRKEKEKQSRRKAEVCLAVLDIKLFSILSKEFQTLFISQPFVCHKINSPCFSKACTLNRVFSRPPKNKRVHFQCRSWQPTRSQFLCMCSADDPRM